MVTVRYIVPVDVTVDTRQRTVTRVQVLDEAAMLSDTNNDAARIAEDAPDWPAWEIGQ
jgi:hypothetical protein